MTSNESPEEKLRAENAELRARVEEAEETLRAIRVGGVDALVPETGARPQILPPDTAGAARKRADHALRLAGENLRDFVDNAAVGLHWVGPDGIILWANRAELQLLGYTQEEYIGHHIAEFHADPPVIEDILRRLTSRETLHEYDARLRCKDGSIREVLIDSNVLWDGDKFIHTRCFTRDVTERRRAEEARAILATIVESSEDAILSKDLDGTIATWNRGAERLFGYSAQEAIGQPVTMLFPPEKLDEELHILADVRSGKRVNPYETVRCRKDGTLLHVSLSVSPIVDARGRIVGASKIVRDITERKQAETDLRESEERFRATFASAPLGIAHVGFDGRWLRFNDAICRITGYEREKLATLTLTDITHPDDVKADGAQARLLLADEIALYSLEKRYIREDGAVVWVNLTRSLLRDEKGAPVNFIAVVEDITERKQADEALRASEARFRAAVGAVSVIVWTNNALGEMEGEQPTWSAFTGQRREDYRGYGWSRAVHPEDSQPTLDAWNQAVAEKRTFEYEHRVRRSDGEWRLCAIRAVPVFDPQGEIREWVGVHTDITERKQSETDLRASEERMRLATEATAVGIWEWNVRTGAIRWDAQMFRIYGLAPTADGFVQYRDWSEAVLPGELPENERILQDTVRRGGQSRREFRIRRRDDGEVREIDCVETARTDEWGQTDRVVGTNLDVTERRQTRAALVAAKEQAEAASRAKDDFLAALSHELRTPLTPVLMTATALQGDPALPLEVRAQLGMMRRNIELQSRLIDDLLDVTRIARGKLNLAPIAADLHQLLEQTAEIVRSDELGKQVRIVFRLDAERHHALADPARLQQVFWNLFKNALKFTPSGGGVVVRTHNDAAGRIVVSVEDNGVGISAAALPHIFTAFEQGDMTGQHRYGGLGLGLAISQAIVAAHGGTIRAESKGAGRGATFTVILASIDVPADASPANIPPSAPARALRLLVVEDHEDTRTVLSRLIMRSGHQVTTAGTMHEALLAFSAEQFDAVISDVGLPDGSGLDLMREIRRQRPVPGIALSGYGMEDDLRETKEAGFFAHLVKPVNLDQLRQLLVHLATRG